MDIAYGIYNKMVYVREHLTAFCPIVDNKIDRVMYGRIVCEQQSSDAFKAKSL